MWAELTGSNALTTRYLRGDGVDQLLARIDIGTSGTTYWTLTDHLGSVREVIDINGVIKDSINYDAYGNITAETNATYRGRYSWTGREIDAETSLQYNRARYYDSTTGRWISQDPLGFDAGDTNLYRYVKNQPVEAADPSGRLLLVANSPEQVNYFKNFFGTTLDLKYNVMPTPDYKYTVFDLSMNSMAAVTAAKKNLKAWQLGAVDAAFDMSDAGIRVIEANDKSWQLKTTASVKMTIQPLEQGANTFFAKNIKVASLQDTFNKGCIGLCQIRFGLKQSQNPFTDPSAKAFTTFVAADNYLKGSKNTGLRMFAMQYTADGKGGWMDSGTRNQVQSPVMVAGSSDQIDLTKTTPLPAQYDFRTLFRTPGEVPYWESMTSGSVTSAKEPDVLNRTVLWPAGGYPNTLFFVLPSGSKFAPPNYDNSVKGECQYVPPMRILVLCSPVHRRRLGPVRSG